MLGGAQAGSTATGVEVVPTENLHKADVVVTSDVTWLFEEVDGMLLPLIYTICLGKPVVSLQNWQSAGGDPAKVDATLIIHHVPAVEEPAHVLCGGDAMTAIRRALRHCAKAEGSKWTVSSKPPHDTARQARPPVVLNDLHEAWKFVLRRRRVKIHMRQQGPMDMCGQRILKQGV